MHPNTSMGYSSNKAKTPPVVMDDCTVPVYGVAFGSSKAGGGNPAFPNTIITTSMLNWEKNKVHIPQKLEQIVKNKIAKNSDANFYIDDEEMFVASRGFMVDEDYFVVL